MGGVFWIKFLYMFEFKGQLSIQMLNSLCDGNYKVYTKGGSACIGWDIQVIICSNYSMAHRVRDLCLRKLFCTIRLGVFIGHVANELALVQDGHTVGEGLHLVHLMGDDHNSIEDNEHTRGGAWKRNKSHPLL